MSPTARRAATSLLLAALATGSASAACLPGGKGPGAVLHIVEVADPTQRDATAEALAARMAELPGSDDIVVRTARDANILVQLPEGMRADRLLGRIVVGLHRVVGDGGATPGAGQKLVRSEDGAEALVIEAEPFVGSPSFSDAQVGFDSALGTPIVTFRLTPDAARRFASFTGEHVGELLAIVIDDTLISAPMIREPIAGGSGIIAGRFTSEEAAAIATALRLGPLPSEVVIGEGYPVGPLARNRATDGPGLMVQIMPSGPVDLAAICAALDGRDLGELSLQAMSGQDPSALVWIAQRDGQVPGDVGRLIEESVGDAAIAPPEQVGPDLVGGGGVLKRLKRIFE